MKAVTEVLSHTHSKYQEILLTRECNGAIVLTLDGYYQFRSDHEHIYHEMLVDSALALSPKIDDVLILGGGDGLALRNALRYPVKKVVLCELDAEMIRLTATRPEMLRLSENSLTDPRAEIRIEDARNFVAETDRQFDVVICDFPDPNNDELQKLFSHTFYAKVKKVLREKGILSVQVSQKPPAFWRVYHRLAQLFARALPFYVQLGRMPNGKVTWASFILAADHDMVPVRDIVKQARFLSFNKLRRLAIRNFNENFFDVAEYRAERYPDRAPRSGN